MLALAILAGALAACGDPAKPPTAPAPTNLAGPAGNVPEFVSDERSWGKFHSKRFQVTIPLPDGKAWKIDDHRQPELVALHPPTGSRLALLATQEADLMNRQRCEARARALGWVPRAELTTVEDEVEAKPKDYDARLWVAIDAGRPDGALEGHVFLFGAYLRRCLLVHLTTQVPSAKNEEVLAARLVLGRVRIVEALGLDPLRTTDDAALPRDKPDIRR